MNDAETISDSRSVVYGKSRLSETAIKGYISGEADDFFRAAACFEAESAEALSLGQFDSDSLLKRRENIKAFIVKVLLFIGLTPHDESFSLLAAALEKIAVYGVEFSRVLQVFAERKHTSEKVLEKTIAKQFELVKNDKQAKRVEYLTGSFPYLPQDAVYDLAVYIKKANADSGETNA